MAAKKKSGSKSKRAKRSTANKRLKQSKITANRRTKAKRTAKQIAATRKLVALNKRKKSGTGTKKGKRKGTGGKKKTKPTKFQSFLMRDPAAAKKKMGW